MKNTQKMQLVVGLILTFIAGFVTVSGCRPRNGATADVVVKPSSTYHRVMAAGEIRAAYYVGAPYYIIDPKTGERSGLFVEVLQLVADRLKLKVNWVEEVGFGQMVEGLKTNRYDIVGSGVWMNAARAREADFTIPILFDAVGLYVRADDNRFDSLPPTALNDPQYTVSTIDGEMASTVASALLPQVKRLDLPQMTDFTQMILNVTTKKADATFLGYAAANDYIAKNPRSIKNPCPGSPVRVFPTAFLIPTDQYQFKRLIDNTITELLNNGEIEPIIRKYEVQPNTHLRVAAPYTQP